MEQQTAYKKKIDVLVVYANAFYPLRVTLQEHLFCFKKYSKNARCFYFNADTGPIPAYLTSIAFDLIIFQTLFLSSRWHGRAIFNNTVVKNIRELKKQNAVKVILPQDEHLFSAILCDFINDFKINIVYSVAPETEWPVIYKTVDLLQVKFHRVLTGYLDKSLLKKIAGIRKKSSKDVDIGYRASRIPAWYGKHGFLKTEIATVFEIEGKKNNLVTDISTDPKDTFYGLDWYRFLARCKYFIGVEGGATVHDPEGEIMKKGILFEKENQHASFEDFEKACFPGLDGNLQLIALSPRHLEACATKTCQVLIEGEYNGILKPGKHYIPVKKDFSDINNAIKTLQEDLLRDQMAETAFIDIIKSGKYTYDYFVSHIIESSLINRSAVNYKGPAVKLIYFYFLNKLIDQFHFYKITKKHPLIDILRKIGTALGFRKLYHIIRG